jgi:ADP-heptose:LPS heptosyltransferase
MLFGGPEERADNEIISRRANPRLVLQPETGNFRQAAALLKTCDAFLSVDTVLMHLAAAMKVPGQVVIEAPTLNVTNLPYGNPFLLVSNPIVAGRNLDYYRYDGLDIKGTDDELKRCMASVSVEAVRARVSEAIG